MSSGCTGCGVCVMACKDKNNLPAGLFWRRVLEKESGYIEKRGQGFFPRVKVSFCSESCRHCRKPPCATVCPVGALEKRADGLVALEPDLCITCGVCQAACPYDALRINPGTGKMSKCDGCPDLLAKGEKPACVTACPLRVLK